LNILPLENEFQYRFLTKVSLKERLKQIKRILLVLMTPREPRLMISTSSNENISNADSSNQELNEQDSVYQNQNRNS